MIGVVDHQFDANSPDGRGDASEHQGNPREGFCETITWAKDVNFIHNQSLEAGQSADKVRDSCQIQKGER